MSIKVKVLKENKSRIDESLFSVLSDPMVIAGLLGVAALGKAALSQASAAIAQGKETPDQTFRRIMGDDWEAQASERLRKEKANKAKYRKELDARYAEREASGVSQDAIGMETFPGLPMNDSPMGGVIPPGMINRYINLKAMSMRGDGAEIDNAIIHMKKMEEKYPGIARHPDVLNAEKLNEAFKRFLI